MKKYFGLQKVILALTTLTLVGLSSCNDQNFDWDEAHATEKYEKFTNVFIKEFGKPADGHQWGFDAAEIAMSGTSGSTSSTRYDSNGNGMYKQEWFVNGIPATIVYGKPANITPREHLEVYAWFLMHKVNWTNTPAKFNPSNDPSTIRQNRTNQSDGIAHLRDDMSYADALEKVNLLAKKEGLTPLSELSFLKKEYNNPNDDYDKINVDHMYFRNAWVQSVANDQYKDVNDDEITGSKEHVTSDKMNYLAVFILNGDGTVSEEHLNDWNASKGYGWYDQNNQNATLLKNCDVNVWTYGSSVSSSFKHDKYYVVKLKGDDYEGYYLGMDLEGYHEDPKNNQYLRANGICNDWIIKINDCGLTSYQNCRIMCEDLGGSTITSSDIDYNDVVLDVNFDGNEREAEVKLTLRAAGGTMPLAIFYGETPLFEVHEFLEYGTTWENGHVKDTNPDIYRTMYNTGLEDSESGIRGTAKPRVFNLGFNKDPQTQVWDWRNCVNIIYDATRRINEPFDFQKLKIKVFRPFADEQGSVEKYITTGNPPASDSYWVNLGNIDGQAPLKICVPQRYNSHPLYNLPVRWMKERVAINKGYPYFRDWVANPAKIFWEYPAERFDPFNLLNYQYFYFNFNNY